MVSNLYDDMFTCIMSENVIGVFGEDGCGRSLEPLEYIVEMLTWVGITHLADIYEVDYRLIVG